MKESKQKVYDYNAWASWSLALSLFWGFGILSIFGIITSILGIRSIKKNAKMQKVQKGMLRAVAGLIIGINGILLTLLHLSSIKEMLAL